MSKSAGTFGTPAGTVLLSHGFSDAATAMHGNKPDVVGRSDIAFDHLEDVAGDEITEGSGVGTSSINSGWASLHIFPIGAKRIAFSCDITLPDASDTAYMTLRGDSAGYVSGVDGDFIYVFVKQQTATSLRFQCRLVSAGLADHIETGWASGTANFSDYTVADAAASHNIKIEDWDTYLKIYCDDVLVDTLTLLTGETVDAEDLTGGYIGIGFAQADILFDNLLVTSLGSTAE